MVDADTPQDPRFTLAKWAQHLPTCVIPTKPQSQWYRECNCGLDNALRALAALTEETTAATIAPMVPLLSPLTENFPIPPSVDCASNAKRERPSG